MDTEDEIDRIVYLGEESDEELMWVTDDPIVVAAHFAVRTHPESYSPADDLP